MPDRGSFLALTARGAANSVRYNNTADYRVPVQLPPLTSTDVLTASMWWARTFNDDSPESDAGAVEVSFVTADGTVQVPLIALPTTTNYTPTPWTLAQGSPASASVLPRISGQAGYLHIVQHLGATDHTVGIDSLTLYRNGQPLMLPMAPPYADQFVGPCPCQSGSQAQQLRNDPVNTYSGAFTTAAADLDLASGGPPLTLQRTYTSLLADPAAYPPSTLGPGWRQSFAHALTLPRSSTPGREIGTVIYEVPTGNRLRFTDRADDGTLTPYPGVRATLVRSGDVYTLTLRDQSVLLFDTQGRLTEQRDPQGQRQTLTYYSGTGQVWDGELQQVSDVTTGRALTFTYTTVLGAARLQSVTDSTTRTISYTYTSAGDLQTATDLRGGVTTYAYAGTSHLLTSITDPLQVVQVVNQYDAQQRIQQQTEANGEVITYTYRVTPDGRATAMQYQHADGSSDDVVDHYRPDGTLEYQERQGWLTRFTTFDASVTPSTIVDGNGHATLVDNTASGLPQTITTATGETTSAVYRPDQRVQQITTPDQVVTAMTYDAAGNLRTRQQQGGSLQQTTTYTPTAENRIGAVRAPDGVVTRYQYDAAQQVTQITVGDGTPAAQQTSYGYDTQGRIQDVTVGAGTPLARTDRTAYNADNTIARTIQNYKDGVFDPARPDEDIVTTYGYDSTGRQIWVKDVSGRYDVTHYDAAGRVDWTAQNFQAAGWNGGTTLPALPAYRPARPDQNVATRYGYDGLGRTVLVTQTGILTGTFNPTTLQWSSASTRVTRTDYDDLSRPVTVTLNYRPGLPSSADTNVQTLTYYDGAGNPTWQRDALGRWTRTDYDALNRPITVTVNYEDGDPLTGPRDADLLTVTRYDRAGRVDRTIDNYVDGVFSATEPITDRVTLFGYDSLGRSMLATQNEDATQTTRTDTNRMTLTVYDTATGRMLGARDPLGRWVSQQYDVLGRVTATIQNCRNTSGTPVSTGCASQTTERNVTTQTRYDALGRAVARVDPLGAVARTVYDGLGRATQTIQNFVAGGASDSQTNVTTRTSYDALGRATTSTDATNATTRQAYNALGQTTVITDAAGRVTQQGSDGTGVMRWTKRPDGQITVMQVDGLGRVVATIQNYQDGVVSTGEPTDQDLITRTVYDAAGRKVQALDAAGRMTQFAYDNLDRLIGVTENALTSGCTTARSDCNVTTQYQDDRAGNRTAIIDANGTVRRFSYNAANELVEERDGLNRVTSYSYDAGGRMTTRTDPRGSAFTLTYQYDELDRATGLSAGSSANLSPISMAYDALGRRTSMTDGTGTTSFGYDPLGRMTSVQAPNTGTVGYQYNARGQRTRLTYPGTGAPVIDYSYLPDGQLDQVRQGSTTLADYAYDTVGRLQSVTRANGATTTYTYDNADRLTDLQTTANATTLSRFQYTLDRLGLRTQVAENVDTTNRTITYGYDDLSRLTSAQESGATTNTYTYSYDQAGNRTDGGRTYDAANQVIGWSYDAAGNLLNDGTTSSTYDALNRAVTTGSMPNAYNADGVLVQQGTTRYVQDLASPLSQILSDGTSTYVYGQERLFAQQGSTRTWYATDALGSVRRTLPDSGAVGGVVNYDPWGQVQSGTVPTFGFTGELQQGNQVYLRARWYNAQRGTFTSRDSFAGWPEQPYSLMPYQYAYANPVLFGDPSGFFCERIGSTTYTWGTTCPQRSVLGTFGDTPVARFAGGFVGRGVEIGSGMAESFTPASLQQAWRGVQVLRYRPAASAQVLWDMAARASQQVARGAAFLWRNPFCALGSLTAEQWGGITFDVAGTYVGVKGILTPRTRTAITTDAALEQNVAETTQQFTYDMVNDPGPLASLRGNPAANFAGGKYNAITLNEDMILYRVGKADTPLGQWFTAQPTASEVLARIDLAVKPQWIDPRTGVLTGQSPIDTSFAVKIPRGTTIYEGPVGYQGGVYLGGQNKTQIFVPTPWNIPGVEVVSQTPIP